MDKKNIAIKFLSILDGFESFYRVINKKLNSNKLSQKIDSIFSKKVKLNELLNISVSAHKIKSLLNKQIDLPKWLTADSFSKSIRLFIKSMFGVTSKLDYRNPRVKIENSRTKIIKIKPINILEPLQKNINKAKYYSSNQFNNLLSLPSNIYLNLNKTFEVIKNLNAKNKRRTKIKVDNRSQTIGVAFYSDHILTVARISINPSNQILVRAVAEVPIPGHVIGDSLVEDKRELANIILDLFNLLNLDNSPLLVILSSSFFKINTFFSSELKQISNTDSKVQSKSPYLPDDTIVEFRSMYKSSSENKLLRTVYSRRKLIEGWTNMLEIVDVPIIGLIPSAPNVFDVLTKKLGQDLTVLVDIEITSTTLLIGRDSADLTSHKLPYGSSLYSIDNTEELSDNYFTRVLASIQLVISEHEQQLPSSIFVVGQGLDNLIKKEKLLPSKFKRVSDMNLSDYSYLPRGMEIHELVSKSIDSTIDTLSCIASSCL